MPTTSSQIIEQHLSRAERLLWSGQPKRGLLLRPSDSLVIPFSLLWCGFAIFWEASVIHSKAPVFFKLGGVPFILFGLYFVFGRFFIDARTRERTYYGVTNERIIIVTGLFTQQISSLTIRNLSEVTLAEHADRSGTITFGPTYPMAYRVPAGWPGAAKYAVPAFDMIDNAKEIYDLIRKIQKSDQ